MLARTVLRRKSTRRTARRRTPPESRTRLVFGTTPYRRSISRSESHRCAARVEPRQLVPKTIVAPWGQDRKTEQKKPVIDCLRVGASGNVPWWGWNAHRRVSDPPQALATAKGRFAEIKTNSEEPSRTPSARERLGLHRPWALGDVTRIPCNVYDADIPRLTKPIMCIERRHTAIVVVHAGLSR